MSQPASTAATRPRVPVLALVILVAVLIGTNYVAIKLALDHSSPLTLTALRNIVGGSVLFAIARLRGDRMPGGAHELIGVAVVSAFVTTTSSAALITGVSHMSAGLSALLAATMPLFAALFAALFLDERFRFLGIIGLALGFLGAAVLASPALGGDTSAFGVGIMLVATASWAAGVVFQKGWKVETIPPMSFVAVQLLMSAVCVTILATVVEGWDARWSVGFAIPLAWCGFLSMAVPFALMATVLQRAPATQAAASAYLIPVFGVIASSIWLRERLAWQEIAGGMLVVVGVIVLSRPAARRVVAAPTDTVFRVEPAVLSR